MEKFIKHRCSEFSKYPWEKIKNDIEVIEHAKRTSEVTIHLVVKNRKRINCDKVKSLLSDISEFNQAYGESINEYILRKLTASFEYNKIKWEDLPCKLIQIDGDKGFRFITLIHGMSLYTELKKFITQQQKIEKETVPISEDLRELINDLSEIPDWDEFIASLNKKLERSKLDFGKAFQLGEGPEIKVNIQSYLKEMVLDEVHEHIKACKMISIKKSKFSQEFRDNYRENFKLIENELYKPLIAPEVAETHQIR